MLREFVIGIVQGAFIGMLLGALNIGFFGKIIQAIGTVIFGPQPFLGIIIIALINIGFYYLFSRKAIKANSMVFILGTVVGVILL